MRRNAKILKIYQYILIGIQCIKNQYLLTQRFSKTLNPPPYLKINKNNFPQLLKTLQPNSSVKILYHQYHAGIIEQRYQIWQMRLQQMWTCVEKWVDYVLNSCEGGGVTVTMVTRRSTSIGGATYISDLLAPVSHYQYRCTPQSVQVGNDCKIELLCRWGDCMLGIVKD